MENQIEQQEAHKNPEGEGEPKVPTLTEEEVAELKRKAEVSSQNFERAKKAELELKELRAKQTAPQFTDDDYSDEGRVLRNEILSLKEEVASFKKLKEEESILSRYPQIKDKADDFKEYLLDPEIKGLSIEKAAKLFMAENELSLNESPKRKGLEKPTSGAKETIKKGYSEEDIRRLRETQPRKYEMMLRSGKLNPDEIIS